MSEQENGADESVLLGRCGFCGAEVPADVETCPECGRPVVGDALVRPRRPVWVRPLAVLLLLLFLVGLAFWVVHLLRP